MSVAVTSARPLDRSFGFDAADLEPAIRHANRALLADQQQDGHYIFDLEADASIPAEYVLVKHYLDEIDPEKERLSANYLRRIQEDHGGWPMLARGEPNISASVKAYWALKAAGDAIDAPHMVKARQAIHKMGGAARVNVFTRTTMALFGVVPWRAVPVMPVEIMHAPGWFPFSIWRISYWARDTLVPLLVMMALKVPARNPRNIGIDELFLEPPFEMRRWPKTVNQIGAWGAAFAALDRVLRLIEPLFPRASRTTAIAKADAFVRERLNGEDGLGAIYPSIANTVMMFHALGVPNDDPAMITAKAALEKLVTVKGDEGFCQPCMSPVWDTVLASQALMEIGPDNAEAVDACLDWLKPLQALDLKGDWAYQRPDLRPGGWAFQYRNDHYVDLDDTAVVVMAMDRARGHSGTTRFDEAIDRAREWVVGMQSANGGWGAFDVDNTSYYLNYIPFADHGALLDPPTADVTARCVSMLAQLGERAETSTPMRRGIEYLLAEQHPEGSWYGRWGLNYIYGTWSVLCAFNAAGIDPDHPAVQRAVAWLERIQNADGGWGEDDKGYALHYKAFSPSPSTASQTAWATIGLMAAGEIDNPAVERGMAYMAATQQADGFWSSERYTATGFPRVFYLNYHGYSKFFPVWAMARYRNLKAGNRATTLYGM